MLQRESLLVVYLLILAVGLFSGCTPNGQSPDKSSAPVEVTQDAPEDSPPKPVDRVEWPDEPLDDTPAAAQFLSLVRAEDESLRAKVRLFNFSETDIVELELELQCNDKDGKKVPCLKPWKTTRKVPARSHVSHVVGAHLPAELEDITIRVVGARMADGNRWPKKKTSRGAER